MIPDLRPRGIGEILDAAVTLYKSRFGPLVRYAAIIVVPVQLFLTLVLLSAQPDSFNVNVTGGATPQFDTGKAQLAAFVVVLAVNFLTHAFVAAVTTKIVADEYVGFAEPASQAARSAFRRFLAVLAVSLLVTLSAVIGLFARFVGAFAAEAVFAVAVPVVILERRGATDAMGRSFQLTKSHFWHVLGVVLAAALLTGLLNAAFSTGLNLWSRHGGGTTALVIAHGLANTIAAMLTAPFTAAAIVALYFDLRIRDEAFDVQMALAA